MQNLNAVSEKNVWVNLIQYARTAIMSCQDDEWDERAENELWDSAQCSITTMTAKLAAPTSERRYEPLMQYLKDVGRTYKKLDSLAMENATHAKVNRLAGKLYALMGIGYGIAYQTLLRDKIVFVKNDVRDIIERVAKARSIESEKLYSAILDGSTESPRVRRDTIELCEYLVSLELLRSDQSGKYKSFSLTPLGKAILEYLKK